MKKEKESGTHAGTGTKKRKGQFSLSELLRAPWSAALCAALLSKKEEN